MAGVPQFDNRVLENLDARLRRFDPQWSTAVFHMHFLYLGILNVRFQVLTAASKNFSVFGM
jgi:hypothetical protein